MEFESLDAIGSRRLARHLVDRYGVPADFLEPLAFVSNKHFGWLVTRAASSLLAAGWNVQGAGILLFVDIQAFKPTTLGIRFLAPFVRRNRIELESRLVPAFLKGARLDLSAEQAIGIDSTGYVAVFCRGDCLGSAFVDLGRKTLHPNLSKTRETDFIEARGFANQLKGRGGASFVRRKKKKQRA